MDMIIVAYSELHVALIPLVGIESLYAKKYTIEQSLAQINHHK